MFIVCGPQLSSCVRVIILLLRGFPSSYCSSFSANRKNLTLSSTFRHSPFVVFYIIRRMSFFFHPCFDALLHFRWALDRSRPGLTRSNAQAAGSFVRFQLPVPGTLPRCRVWGFMLLELAVCALYRIIEWVVVHACNISEPLKFVQTVSADSPPSSFLMLALSRRICSTPKCMEGVCGSEWWFVKCAVGRWLGKKHVAKPRKGRAENWDRADIEAYSVFVMARPSPSW